MKEKKTFYMNGYLGLVLLIALVLLSGYLFIQGALHENMSLIITGVIIFLISALFISSLTIVGPNQAKAILFFGKYLGTIKESGLFITVPLAQKLGISLKVRNLNSSVLKVNDSDGNPIEISAVVVFRVVDTYRSIFGVDNYRDFVEIQSETAIRHIASQYPYDSFTDDDITLRGNNKPSLRRTC